MTAKEKRNKKEMIKMIDDFDGKMNNEKEAVGFEVKKKQLFREEGDPMIA